MNNSWSYWDWFLFIFIAMTGIAGRLSHTWAERNEKNVVPRLTTGEIVSALVSAPLLGVMAGSVGDYMDLSQGTVFGLAGFAGLMGPALLLSLWKKIGEPWSKRVLGGSKVED